MFMLKSLGKYIWGNTNSTEIVQIPYGQLYSVHENYRECMFKDASASIRRTTAEFQYQLVIQRAYEEGEEELEDDGDEAEDEQSFLLDEKLHLRFDVNKDSITIMWDNPDFQDGTLYEFTCENCLQEGVAYTFEMVALQCMYERKYRQSHEKATLADLEQFSNPITRPSKEVDSLENIVTKLDLESEDLMRLKKQEQLDDEIAKKYLLGQQEAEEPLVQQQTSIVNPEKEEVTKTENIKSLEGELMGTISAELHLFDAVEEVFILQDPNVEASVFDLGDWNYWFTISTEEKTWLSQSVDADMNPVFSFEHLSFIWNYFDANSNAFSWLLRFDSQVRMEQFQELLMRALWESLNQQRWLKIDDEQRDYVMETFHEDEELEDSEDEEFARQQLLSRKEEEEEEDEEASDFEDSFADFSDGEADDLDESRWRKEAAKEHNSLLAVGYKNDRSYVVRNNKIGVFKHVDEKGLKFQTALNNLSTPKGKSLRPSKLMLHNQDSSILFQTENAPHSLYHMDIEYGKIVDEWKVHDDVPLVTFTPDNKFAQMTAEQTLIGLSNNSIFRIDPRVEGNKLVAEQFKQYATKNDFSSAATTENGYIAVASNKGDIRLFDRIGVNAKTALPALGEAIIGVDVTASGDFVLATCKTYILLIDTRIKEGRYAGRLGFERNFAKDKKPKPKRLQLSPQHIAMMQRELKGGASFTPAKFNTGIDAKETTIVSSIGPFLISWNLDRVKRGFTDSYKIRRYDANVQAEDFRFGTDRSLIVALPDDVAMVDKSSLRRPTRESICTPVKKLRSKHDIVNAPY
ncbi:WD repeat protein, Vid27 family, conserved in fungi and plants [Schizosaccharomyces pombe]|uniref:Vacuolar import and degradation protein 27 n=1 Tax=Schizosaccharomyces pombe (strain 972 / ATCC 24843) TaxID=284812 RepID=VID27_SCHPO|nr:Vid27 family protein [Schizosaccharomyces pombe]Q1MTR3.1 RecName: Full=Vacuolar import and degradation protein 27 [Schizosaccharomyces pombe 972h-]CAA20062.2 Vid27 family protein [Schizosaccharomyces pombe]|eukprot:NP_595218.1 Vid27 family protein [Schizosaccharomyces pombe]